MEEFYFWNIIELKEDDIVYAYHFLTLNKLNLKELELVYEKIKEEEIKIELMTEKITGTVLFNKKFKLIKTENKKFILGKSQYSKDFFYKFYVNSIKTFNILDLDNFDIKRL